jgi:tetratricopeptide (TPR) repeat protein
VIRKTLFRTVALLAICLLSLGQATPTYSPHKYQQNDWFGEFGQNASMFVNPAGIAENDQLEASLGIFQTIGGEAGQEYISMVVPYDYDHSFGFSFFENGAVIEGGLQYVENAYMFGYAYRVMHALAVGVDLAILHINQFDKDMQITPGIDLGVSWNPVSNSKLGHIQVGLAVQNVLAPAISTKGDEEFKVVLMGAEDSYQVPTNLNFSIFYRGLNRMLEAKLELSVIDLLHDEAEGGKGGNLENSASFTYYLSHFLGVRLRFTKEGYPVLGTTINVKDVNFFKYLALDLEMSHDDIVEQKNRGFLWNVKLTSRFGPTREESIGLRRYRRLKIEPENDYRRAMRLYLNREFLEAAYAFGKVITKYPAFHLVDQAAFYKGKSFENMRMHKAARTTYEEAIKKYPHSDQRAKYHFQLMNIDYKDGKFGESIIKYQGISQKFSDTDIKADADYIAGQIKFEQQLYQECIDLMSPILPGNANYFYARYTMGIAYSRLGKWKEAEESFRDVINQQSSNKSESDLQDAATVKLGHIFFSGGEGDPNLAEAAAQYGKIKVGSHVYDEALLAMAWSFIKVAKPDQAIEMVQWIIKNQKGSYLIAEAYLVEGYCHMMKKRWKEADKSLATAEELTKAPLITQASKDSANQAYSAMLGNFEEVQMKALDLARQLPTTRVEKKRADLQPKFDKANQEIENYAQFLTKALQSDRFEANRKRILEDAQFGRASVGVHLDGDGGGSSGDMPDLQEL